MLGQLLLLLVAFVLIAGTSLFVASEFSLVTVDRAAVARKAADGRPVEKARAQVLQSALRSLSTQLSGAQVGITVTTLALGFVMEPSLAALLVPPLQALGLSASGAESVAVPVALLIATVLSMVFGELVPKNLALAQPLETALWIARPQRVATRIFRPLIWVLNGVANGVLAVLGVEPQEELRSARSPQELRSLVRRSADQGTLEAPTAGLLARTLDFPDKTAADVLTPRVRVDFLHRDATAADVVAAAVRTGHSRFPVIGTDADEVLGQVHVKRAVAIPADQRSAVSAEQLMVSAPTVPETLPLGPLLDQLREGGLQLAVVVDEFGGTAGILTLEDVVEELIGEITDEHDSPAGRPHRRTDGVWLVPGQSRPDEISERTGVSLPESGAYETVAGLILDRLDRLARAGDSITVDAVVAPEVDLGVLSDDLDPDIVSDIYDRDRALPAEPGIDVPRAYQVRLTVSRIVRRRVETVLLSAVGPVA